MSTLRLERRFAAPVISVKLGVTGSGDAGPWARGDEPSRLRLCDVVASTLKKGSWALIGAFGRPSPWRGPDGEVELPY